MQGSPNANAETVDWYDIEFEDLETRTTVDEIIYSVSTRRTAINVEGYHPYLRLSLQVSDGLVDNIIYR